MVSKSDIINGICMEDGNSLLYHFRFSINTYDLYGLSHFNDLLLSNVSVKIFDNTFIFIKHDNLCAYMIVTHNIFRDENVTLYVHSLFVALSLYLQLLLPFYQNKRVRISMLEDFI